jgi:hypothetical protein
MCGRSKTALGTLLAALALSGPAAASAGAEVFAAQSYPATISGSQWEGKHLFETVANTLYCNKYNFSGSLSAASNELALAATPSECSTLGIVVMTVSMNGCTWNFNVGKELEAGRFSGSGHIACPTGKEIVWTASSGNCTAKIPAQTLSGTFTLENTATEPGTVKLSTEATGITYTLNPTAGCLNKPEAGTYHNGVYKGITKLGAGGAWLAVQ